MDDPKCKGWICLHRKLLNSPVWTNHNVARFWIWCLMKATHAERIATIGYQQISLSKGQFIFGRKVAAEETGLSEQIIRTSLDFLKTQGNLTIKPTNKFSILTIVNWDAYQYRDGEDNQQINQQLTNKQPTINQQLTTDNNVNNINNADNEDNKPKTLVEDTAFDVFWKAWPGNKGVGKEVARTKWKKKKLDAKADHIMSVLEALKKSKQWTRDNGQFIPLLSTWLNQERYDCELEDLLDKRDTKVNPIAKQIAATHNVTYGVDTPRAQEMMQADPPFERTKKLRAVQKITGNAKMTVWKAYLYLAEQERNEQ